MQTNACIQKFWACPSTQRDRDTKREKNRLGFLFWSTSFIPALFLSAVLSGFPVSYSKIPKSFVDVC